MELLKQKAPTSVSASKIKKEDLTFLRDALGLKSRPDPSASFKDLMNVRPDTSAFRWCALQLYLNVHFVRGLAQNRTQFF